MDITRSTAVQAYSRAQQAAKPDPNASPAAMAKEFGETFAATLQRSEEMATKAMISDVDPHSVVQALAQAELAVETAVTVRNKVVEAYQEILRMQM